MPDGTAGNGFSVDDHDESKNESKAQGRPKSDPRVHATLNGAQAVFKDTLGSLRVASASIREARASF